jgi:hypothetical protein
MDYRKREQRYLMNEFERELIELIEHFELDELLEIPPTTITNFMVGGIQGLLSQKQYDRERLHKNKKEFEKLQIGDEVSFLKINPKRKGIKIKKWYKINNVWFDTRKNKGIGFTGEDKKRIYFRNDIGDTNVYQIELKFKKIK